MSETYTAVNPLQTFARLKLIASACNDGDGGKILSQCDLNSDKRAGLGWIQLQDAAGNIQKFISDRPLQSTYAALLAAAHTGNLKTKTAKISVPNDFLSVTKRLDEERQKLIEITEPKTVRIEVSKQGKMGVGSGWFHIVRTIPNEDKTFTYLILTNHHVIEGGESFTVKAVNPTSPSATLSLPAQLVGSSSSFDLAVLAVKSPHKHPLLEMGDSSKLPKGATVMAFGNPFGFEKVTTLGIVSNPAQNTTAFYGILDIQTDAAIDPGNSGGPLVAADGKCYGMNSWGLSGAKTAFAHPSNVVKKIARDIISGKVSNDGTVPFEVVPINPEDRILLRHYARNDKDLQKVVGHIGAKVVWVEPGSDLEKAGLLPGDIIIKMEIPNKPSNDLLISNAHAHPRNLVQRWATINKPGTPIGITVYRKTHYTNDKGQTIPWLHVHYFEDKIQKQKEKDHMIDQQWGIGVSKIQKNKLLITDVLPNSPAAAAKLLPGKFILREILGPQQIGTSGLTSVKQFHETLLIFKELGLGQMMVLVSPVDEPDAIITIPLQMAPPQP